MLNIAQNLKHIRRALAAGNITEHTHHAALKSFIESLVEGVSSPRSQKLSH